LEVIVDPRDPNVVSSRRSACVWRQSRFGWSTGRATASELAERAVKEHDVGAIDLASIPAIRRTIYASLWNTRRPPWSIYPPSYGPGSGPL